MGGREPVTGLHSVMLRPDSVSRVRPPNTTMPKTLAALPSSQYATPLELVLGKDRDLVAAIASDSALCDGRDDISLVSFPRGDVVVCVVVSVA